MNQTVFMDGYHKNDGNFLLYSTIIIKSRLEMRFKERDQSSVRAYQRISLGVHEVLFRNVSVWWIWL